MDIILHLGGSGKAAVEQATALYLHIDGVRIFVSSENPKHVDSYDLSPNKIFHHREAWDTVTNFTTTYDYIRRNYGPKKIYIVCHGFHMPRAMAIAKAVYWKRGVKLIPSPASDSEPREKDRSITVQDTWRAWVWRLTGILFYWKSLRDTRVGDYEPKWNEIPIERLSFLPSSIKKALHI